VKIPHLPRRGDLARTVALCLFVALYACESTSSNAPKSGNASENAKKATGAESIDPHRAATVIGFIVAREFTTLRAPPNVFKLAGWSSRSSRTELVYLASEGKHVKKGDLVARFAFRHKRALFWVKDHIRNAEAVAQRSRIEQDKKLAALIAERNRHVLEAHAAYLDTLKARTISRRQLLIYRIAYKAARFEVDAIGARLNAQRQTRLAEASYQRQHVGLQKTQLARYHRYKTRYELHAPHDGVVRHSYYRRRRRKIKKGDGMPAGMPVIYLGKDNRLAVRFFVPENRIREISVGKEVIVLGTRAGQDDRARVFKIERFPQEIGFLRLMPDLPNAREKAFVVIAGLPSKSKFTAGGEVHVRLTIRESTP